jgi:hypothetical protein
MNRILIVKIHIILTSLLFISCGHSKEVFSMQSQIDDNKLNQPETSLYRTWRSYRSESYVHPSASELKDASGFFSSLFEVVFKADNNTQKLTKQINQINLNSHFTVVEKDFLNETLFIVSEHKAHRSGSGFYVFRKNGNGVMLQAPHAFKDLNSGSLAIKLMQEGNYSGLALNTVPRKYKTISKEVDADVAHLSSSFFMAASIEFSRHFPQGQIIQLHGYNSDRREETKNTSMIISPGSKSLMSPIIRQQSCLMQNLTPKVLVYPKDINLLGGTTNTIGQALRNFGYTGFRHFEMSLPLRKRMLKSRKSRDIFSQCIDS